ncbi:Cobalt/magnesium transport protein CorA [subsurface metagenome]
MKTLIYDRKKETINFDTPKKDMVALVGNANYIMWLDIDEPYKEDMDWLKENFNFHPLDLEDCISLTERPKIDLYEDYHFLVMHFPVFDKITRRLSPIQVNVFLGTNFLVTIRKSYIKSLNRTFENVSKDKELLHKGTDYLLHKVIDDLVDYCFPILEKIRGNIQNVENMVFDGATRQTIRDILIIKRNIILFKNILDPQIRILRRIEVRDSKFIAEELEVYFGDIVDHLQKIEDSLESYGEIIEGLQDAHQSLVSNRINEIMKILTIISIMMLPLTLISSVYGMNIMLPISKSPFAFLIIISIMILMALGMFVYFKIKHWI